MKSTGPDKPQFSSFFMAGYECVYALDQKRGRLDRVAETLHDTYCREDYRLIKNLNITTVREGLAWHQIDKGNGIYDFSRFERMMQIGKEENIQQIWDLNHFDYPEYLDPFSDAFISAFTEYARRAVHIIRKYQPAGSLFIAPMNEISFFAWIGADMGWWAPFTKGFENGYKFKKQLVKACINAMDAMWEEDTDIRFIHIDPIMIRKPKNNFSKLSNQVARDFNQNIKYQAWDLLSGRLEPELGGDPKYLDIIGLNHYYDNQQWVRSRKKDNYEISYWNIPWYSKYRISFEEIIRDVYKRYKRPMIISETGSYGELRFRWWTRTLKQIDDAIEHNLPIHGVCGYPIIDTRYGDDNHLTNCGLWDFQDDDPGCRRVPHEKSIAVVKKYAERWKNL